MSHMTAEQDRAFAFLNDRYGDARTTHVGTFGDVRIEAIDEDDDVRARWTVRPDGTIAGAWDPDAARDHYEQATR